MNKLKKEALEKEGWKIGCADEFLKVEKLDFMSCEDMLEALVYNKDKKLLGFFRITFYKDWIVTAYIDSKYFEIKKDCKNIYESLDVANQWWNENKSEWENILK